MGCDGGTIPTRDELVKTKKRPEQKDKDSERLFQWQHCHLTQEPLRKPIVSCQMGRLYNKETLIEKLLEKNNNKAQDEQQQQNIDHIKGLKDIKELELTPNPSFRSKNPSVGDNYVDRLISPWICPITGLEMNGRFKFVFDWSNGKVLSERAYKMVKDDDASKILEEDMIILNPVDEEVDLMLTKMKARKSRAKLEKKSKKEKKRKNEIEDGKSSETDNNVGTTTSSSKKDEKVKSKKSKIETNGNPKSSAIIPVDTRDADTNTALQKDVSKSEVYKSLFSSHSSAQNKPKGNWVTFDPRYN